MITSVARVATKTNHQILSTSLKRATRFPSTAGTKALVIRLDRLVHNAHRIDPRRRKQRRTRGKQTRKGRPTTLTNARKSTCRKELSPGDLQSEWGAIRNRNRGQDRIGIGRRINRNPQPSPESSHVKVTDRHAAVDEPIGTAEITQKTRIAAVAVSP
jgi:hypothetical protein